MPGKTLKTLTLIGTILVSLFFVLRTTHAEGKPIFLVHLKTALGKDDAQLCVAYNVIWAAIEKGYNVKVLVDASAIDTFKKGWFSGEDHISGYKVPENLRKTLAKQFNRPVTDIPKTYGEFINMLYNLGAEFYINRAYLIVSKAGTEDEPLKNITVKFFKPVTIMDMIQLRKEANIYMVY